MKITRIFIPLLLLTIVISALAGSPQIKAQETSEGVALLRIAQFAKKLRQADIYINDEINQRGLDRGEITEYMEAATDTPLTATVVPGNASINNAVVGPLDLSLAAGHHYTLVVMGQADDTVTYQLIDETALLNEFAPDKTKAVGIFLNGLVSDTALDVLIDDEVASAGLAPGNIGMFAIEPGSRTASTTVSGDASSGLIPPLPGEIRAGDLIFSGVFGEYPGALRTDFDAGRARTNFLHVIDFLSALSAPTGTPSSSFRLVLEGYANSELTELLNGDGTYTVFVPRDSALSALPRDIQSALFDNAELVTKSLSYEVVEGFYTFERLRESVDTLTTVDGQTIQVVKTTENEVLLNDQIELGAGMTIGNAHVYLVDAVLLPPDEFPVTLVDTGESVSMDSEARGEITETRTRLRYSYTAEQNGIVDIVVDAEGDFDTRVRIYDAGGHMIRQNDDDGPGFAATPLSSAVRALEVTAGQRLTIEVGHYSDAQTGAFTVHVEASTPR